ncbi:MAG TPA: ISL3 family transposase, partial [Polyangiaceae bacterium]|nr:ISL3 family transposase [Polyangiaceae bacterium]
AEVVFGLCDATRSQQMGQLNRFIAEVLGFEGWKVLDWWWERDDGVAYRPVSPALVPPGAKLVIRVGRQWMGRCVVCGARCGKVHEHLQVRRWRDLPWCDHPVELEYAPDRLACRRCCSASVELLPWAERAQRETMRFQQHVALDASSMPLSHAATRYGIDWHTARRAEQHALQRWQATRTPEPLTMVGVDEKYLGRRNTFDDKYVTIVSNLQNGEPIWIGFGRGETTLGQWLGTLSDEQKAAIRLFAMDMHAPFKAAIRADEKLAHAEITHDPFHIMKRAGEAIDELRRQVFFRAGPQMRALGRGKRWLFKKAWDNCSPEEKAELKKLLGLNGKLAHAYQVVEELREVLHAPDEFSMLLGLTHVLRRIERRDNKPMRGLHDCIDRHFPEILALGKHRPPVGRVEALNNNWETLVRQGRGYRDLQYLLLKLRFAIANPVRAEDGVLRFLALGLPAPYRKAA